MADPVVLAHIEGSNLPRSEKNAIMRFVSRAGHGIRSYGGRAGRFAISTHRSAPVATGLGMVTGSILGAIHVKAPQGLDVDGKAPADLIASLAATALAMGAHAGGSHNISHHMKTVAIATGSVFAFRKTVDLASELERRKGRSPGGTVGQKRMASPGVATHHGEGEDPLAAFAKTL
jgi:hypothetical protein